MDKIKVTGEQPYFITENRMISDISKLGAYHYLIYSILLRWKNQDSENSWPSIERIIEEGNTSRPTVVKVLKELKNEGFITEVGNWKNGQHKTYRVLLGNEYPNKSTSKEGLLVTKPVKELNCTSKGALPQPVKELNPTSTNTSTNTITTLSEQARQTGDINSLLDIFHDSVNPEINYGNKTQRKYLKELVGKYGYHKIKATIEYAVSVQYDPYAPTIMNPLQLKEKLGALKAHYKKNHNSTVAIIT